MPYVLTSFSLCRLLYIYELLWFLVNVYIILKQNIDFWGYAISDIFEEYVILKNFIGSDSDLLDEKELICEYFLIKLFDKKLSGLKQRKVCFQDLWAWK